MQYFYTNLTIFDEINADDMDLRDEIYDEFSDRVDELMGPINPEDFGIDRFKYAGKEEEDMNLVIGFEDGKNAEELVKKFEAFFIPKLNAIVSALAEEYGVTIDESNFDFEKDEEGFYEDDDDMDESKKVKKGDKDKELNEAELSAVKNSIATLAKKYIAGSFFDKLVATTGISQAKDILLGDLKNMVGKGTSAPAAAKFAQAIKFAKSTTAVDTILANYMLAGDGMKSGIGYNESVQPTDHIEAFRKYLAESRKADLDEKCKGCCGKKDDKKKPTEEEIAEAIKVVEATGQKVIAPTQNVDEKKGCCGGKKDDEKDDKKPNEKDDKKKLEEALAIIKAAGIKVDEASGDDWVTVPTLDVDPDDLKAAIDDGIALRYIRGCGSITNIRSLDGKLMIQFVQTAFRAKDILSAIRDGLKKMFQEDASSVVTYGEDVVDGLDRIFDAAIEQA